MAEIFISYSRKDRDFVRKLSDALEKRGRDAWVDWEGIAPTEKWLTTIRSAIDEAEAFLFVISPDSVASEVCGIELDHAIKQHKRLIPVVYRDADAVRRELSELHYVFARNDDSFDSACETLITALDTDLEWTRAHTRLLVRSTDWDREGRDKSFTLRGRDLSDFEEWLAKSPDMEPKPTTLQSEYLLASRRAVTRRQRFLWGSLAVALSIAVGLTTIAYFQKRERVRQETIAEARRLVNQSTFREGTIDDPTSGIELMNSIRSATRALQTFNGLGIVSLDADQAVRKSFAALPRWSHFGLRSMHIDAAAFDTRAEYLALFLGRKQLMLWGTATEQEAGNCTQPLTEGESVLGVAAAGDGKHAATAVYGGTRDADRTELSVWSMPDCSRRLLAQVPGRQGQIVLPGNGNYLLLKSGLAIRVWNVAEQSEQPIAFTERVGAFAANANGNKLATIESNQNRSKFWVRIRDLDTNELVREWLMPENARSLQWPGQTLVAGNQQTVWKYNSDDGQLMQSQPAIRNRIAVSPDGALVAVLHKPYTIQIVDAATKSELARTYYAASDAGGHLAFTRDNRSLVAVDEYKRSISVWGFASDGASFTLPEELPITQMKFAEDSSRLDTATAENTKAWRLPAPGQLAPPIWQTAPKAGVNLLPEYEIERGESAITLQPNNAQSEPRIIEFAARTMASTVSQNGNRLAVTVSTGSSRGGERRSLEVWDTLTGTRIAARDFEPLLDSRAASYLEFVGDDRFVVIGKRTGVEIMETDGLTTIATLFHQNVTRTAVNGNGSLAASMESNGVVRIWELAGGGEIARVEAAPTVIALALSNDRRWLATLEDAGKVRLWTLVPGDLIQQACHWVENGCPHRE